MRIERALDESPIRRASSVVDGIKREVRLENGNFSIYHGSEEEPLVLKSTGWRVEELVALYEYITSWSPIQSPW